MKNYNLTQPHTELSDASLAELKGVLTTQSSIQRRNIFRFSAWTAPVNVTMTQTPAVRLWKNRTDAVNARASHLTHT
ncbi:MAG: hypothetical protein FJY29_07190 [Betaproteobacteria bacterium]|nr:hypothetical protein [Betaproteobacteria bacterium]